MGPSHSIKTKDGTITKDIHLEDVMLVPENTRNLEKEPPHFLEEDSLTLDDINERRSPGMMIEDQGRKVEEQAKQLIEARKRQSPGKMDTVHAGNHVVYVIDGSRKECTVGKVTALSKAEATVIVHRYRPVSDNHMRLHWEPIYVEGGAEVLGLILDRLSDSVLDRPVWVVPVS